MHVGNIYQISKTEKLGRDESIKQFSTQPTLHTFNVENM